LPIRQRSTACSAARPVSAARRSGPIRMPPPSQSERSPCSLTAMSNRACHGASSRSSAP
jgi:hypothetical protein